MYKITALRHTSAVWLRLVFSRYHKVVLRSMVVGCIAVLGLGCELSGANFAEQIARSITNQASGTIQGAASQALQQQQQQVQELAERGEQLLASGVPDPSQIIGGAAELTQGVPERLERGRELFVSRVPDPSQMFGGVAGLTRGVPVRLGRGEQPLVPSAPDPTRIVGGATAPAPGIPEQPRREEQPLAPSAPDPEQVVGGAAESTQRVPEQPKREEQPRESSVPKAPSDASVPAQPSAQKVDEADISPLERDRLEEERINRWKEEQARIVAIKRTQEAEVKQSQTPVSTEVEDEQKKKTEE